MITGNEFVYPLATNTILTKGTKGLTKIEYFTGIAMSALASKVDNYSTPESIAAEAVKIAIATINELNKLEPE